MAESEVKNRPAPCDVSRWQDALTTEWGKLSDGRPKVRLVWGQQARHFARGDKRIKYPTEKFIEKKTYAYYLKDLKTGELTPVTYAEAHSARTPNVLPLSYLLSQEVEWIGEARWFVEEFHPTELWGDAETWERNRYDYSNERDDLWLKKVFVPHLSLWREDRLGPYPRNGKYDFLLRVEHEGKYCLPNDRTLEQVREIFQKRAEHKTVVDAQVKVTGFYRQVEEYDLVQAERMTKRITQETLKDLRPLIQVPSIN